MKTNTKAAALVAVALATPIAVSTVAYLFVDKTPEGHPKPLGTGGTVALFAATFAVEFAIFRSIV